MMVMVMMLMRMMMMAMMLMWMMKILETVPHTKEETTWIVFFSSSHNLCFPPSQWVWIECVCGGVSVSVWMSVWVCECVSVQRLQLPSLFIPWPRAKSGAQGVQSLTFQKLPTFSLLSHERDFKAHPLFNISLLQPLEFLFSAHLLTFFLWWNVSV